MSAGLLLLFVRFALLILPFRLITRALGAATRAGVTPTPTANRIAWAVRAAARTLPLDRQCLAEALTMRALLAWHGHPARLRIGVARRGDRTFHAHAWVEIQDGHSLDEFSVAAFTRLPALDRDQP